MSTELKGTNSRNGKVSLTRFAGEGRCLQLNCGLDPFISVTRHQALDLAVALVEFANNTREELE